MQSPSRALDTDWFLQTILIEYPKKFVTVKQNVVFQKYAMLLYSGKLTPSATLTDLKIPRID